MFSRITFVLIATFWVVMTYLLWRTEYVGRNELGSNVPVALVWKKILTAPDGSPLEIMHNDHKVGYCRWASNISQALLSSKFATEDAAPEGMEQQIACYLLDLEGSLTIEGLPSRLQFDSEIRLSTNNYWQEFHTRLKMRPSIWEVNSIAKEQTVHFLLQEDTYGRTEKVLKFSDLQNPQTLMEEFDLPPALGMLGALSPFSHNTVGSPLEMELQWKARNDWVTLGHSSVRAYRLEATLLERFHIRIIVSRVGEILRVELPDNWELINEQLVTL